MDLFYQFVELFASFIEAVIVFSVASSMAQRRYNGWKNIALILLFSLFETILVTFFNKIESFSLITITIGMVFIFIVLNVLSSGSILLKFLSTVMTLFFMFAVDYLIMYSFIMIAGKSIDISKGVTLFLSPGIPRLIFLLTVKSLQALVFILCRKLYSKIKLLDNKNQAILSVITLLTFFVMNVLAGLIYTDSLLVIQVAVIFATFFIVISMIAMIFAIAVSAKHQNEKQTVELMKMSCLMMEKKLSRNA